MIPISDVDIRKYIVTDPQRINNHSSPFSFRLLNRCEHISYPRITDFPSIIENHSFNENDLVLFKQNMDSSFPLELKNCIHQLAIERKLENREVCNLLIRLDQQINQNEFYLQDIPKIIRNLQKAASNNRTETSESNLSDLMKVFLRIDQLGKLNKLDKEKVRLFNERIYHLYVKKYPINILLMSFSLEHEWGY
jgi:hypothetical protein